LWGRSIGEKGLGAGAEEPPDGDVERLRPLVLSTAMTDGEQRIEPLSASEMKWLDTNLALSRSFVNRHDGGTVVEGVPTAAALDRAWSAWLAEWESAPAETREDPNPILNAVGVALGQHLVDVLGLRWAIVTDPYGTEVAVHGEPGEVLLFPPNLVGKRFANRTTGFIAPLLAQVCADVRCIRSAGVSP
jgi:hypothetical protein